MKKLLMIIIFLSILLSVSACRDRTEATPSPTPSPSVATGPASTDLPVHQRKEEEPGIHIFRIETPGNQMTGMDRMAWSLYMEERHGLEISFDYLTRIYPEGGVRPEYWLREYVGIDTAELDEMESLDGFVMYNSITELVQLMDGGYIMPVNEYIDDIPSLAKLLPQRFDGFTDPEGMIWALPVNPDMGIFRRVYNKEWLDSYGKGSPKTPEEFRDYARFVAFEDPDGNGIDDTYIAAFSQFDFMSSLFDIFLAFGCYSDGIFVIGYDPHTGEFVSPTTRQEFIDAVAFIKELCDEGLLMYSINWGYETDSEENGYLLASVRSTGYIPEYFNGYTIGEPLMGTNETYLLEDINLHTGLAVLRDTKDVAQKFNVLAETAGKDMYAYMDIYAGMEGRNWDRQEGFIVLKQWDEDGIIPGIGLGLNLLLEEEEEMDIISNGPIQDPEPMELYNRVWADIIQSNLEFAGTPVLYAEPVIPGSSRVYGIKMYCRSTFRDLVERIFEKNHDILSTVESYNSTFEAAGVFDILDEINGE